MKKKQTRLAVAGIALLGAALIPALNSLYAAEEAESPSTQTHIETADMKINLTAGKPTNWGKQVDLLAPGDTVITYVDLVNVGEAPVGSVDLVATGDGKIMDGKYALRATLQMCSQQYDSNGKCNGQTTDLGDASKTVAKFNKRLETGDKYYMKMITIMPYYADNSYQGAKGTLSYKFDAVQAPVTDEVPTPKRG